MSRKTLPVSRSKRALMLIGTPIYDSVVSDLEFDPAASWSEPVIGPTPKSIAKRVSKRTTTNPKVTA